MENNLHLKISGILFTSILLLWLIFMVATSVSGSIEEQILHHKENINLYKINFLIAFFIGPTFVYLMLSYKSYLGNIDTLEYKMGQILLIVYLCFVSISYSSQVVYFPKLLENNLIEESKLWYFGYENSFPYYINQTGYFIWALSALVLFVGDLRKSGLIRVITIVFILSSILSILAFIGLIIGSSLLNLMTIPSGALLLLIGIFIIVLGVKKLESHDI